MTTTPRPRRKWTDHHQPPTRRSTPHARRICLATVKRLADCTTQEQVFTRIKAGRLPKPISSHDGGIWFDEPAVHAALATPLAYLSRLPDAVPTGTLLVHNVRPTLRLGSRGFRAWLQSPDDPPAIKACLCRWAAELGTHYRVAACPLADP